ncbi:MAG TPA: hypothetical protein VEF06_03000 [Bryobacteraceae bacterium]|nr:hypothetical protein [Bryobacteraceae bacterium]
MKALALFSLLLPLAAQAAVADSAPNGFTIKFSLTVNAPPDEVYGKLVRNIGGWWSPDHTFSHDPRNLSIEEKAMGCFCEKMPDGGAARHLEIIYFEPGKRIVMIGGLGPMQTLGVTGSLAVELSPGDHGTKVDVSYAVGGYRPGGFDKLASVVDGVLMDQFTRLRNFVETGQP